MATGIPKNKWTSDEPRTKHDLRSDVMLDVNLAYEGKLPYEQVVGTPKAKILQLNEASNQQENSLYYGDNLSVMAALLDNDEIRGKVRLVYIDPPFATNSVFQSRTQNDAYCDLLVGAHYIEFLRRRLILIRELLADDGSIYVHLDDNMAFHIKVIMDEIFGRANFRNWITRKKCNPKNYTRNTYGNVSDYILFYSKSNDYVWNRAYEQWTVERAEKEYQYIEEGTGRRYKKVPVHAPGTRNGETGKTWNGMLPPPGKHWQYKPATLDEMDARGEIYWSPNGNPRRKVYLDQSEGIPVQDIWMDFRDAHNQNIKITGYPTEKNSDMLARIISASSNPGDLILDCFSGSGTTLSVGGLLGRKWIGIDNSKEAIYTSLRRFSKGLERMGDFVSKKDGPKSNVTIRLFEDNQEVAPEPLADKKLTTIGLYATKPYQGDLDLIMEEVF